MSYFSAFQCKERLLNTASKQEGDSNVWEKVAHFILILKVCNVEVDYKMRGLFLVCVFSSLLVCFSCKPADSKEDQLGVAVQVLKD